MKLTIAVQKPRESTTTLREETSYRWDRIVATGLGALSLLAFVVWVFWPSAKQDSAEQLALQESADLPLFSSEAPEPPRPPQQDHSLDSSPPGNSAPAAATSATETIAVSPDGEESRKTDTQATLNAVAIEQPRVSEPASSQPRPSSSPEPQSSELEGPAGLFSQLNTTIHSDKIRRFSLASSVRNKEPVGDLSDITLSNDKVATVFAYSEAMDLKDDTLRYVWKLNGSELAQVKVPVWSARWRSHSSKFVTPGMRGDWKVELRSSSGELLAMSEFQY